MTEIKFWLITLGAAFIYGLMAWGSYGLPVAIDPHVGATTWSLLVSTVLFGTYSWLPSFLAALLMGRRGVLLGVLTVAGGAVSKSVFHGMYSPMLIMDDWDPPIVNLTQGLVAVVTAVVSGIAGQCISSRRSSNKPLQPIAREDARSG